MTFEEYAEKHQDTARLSYSAIELVRMGWNARGNYGNSQGILDGSDHVRDVTKMVQGAVALMGDVTDEDGTTYHKAMVVQFATVEDFHAAMKAGQCRFAVFGGEV